MINYQYIRGLTRYEIHKIERFLCYDRVTTKTERIAKELNMFRNRSQTTIQPLYSLKLFLSIKLLQYANDTHVNFTI